MFTKSIVHSGSKGLEINLAFGHHISHFSFTYMKVLSKCRRRVHASRRKLKKLFAHQSAVTGDRCENFANRIILAIRHSRNARNSPKRCEHLITRTHTGSCKLRSNLCGRVQTVCSTINGVVNVLHNGRDLLFIFEQTLELEVCILQIHGSSDTALNNAASYKAQSSICKLHCRVREILNDSHTDDPQCRKTILQCLNTCCHLAKVNISGGLLNILQTFRSAVHIQALFQFVECTHASLDIAFELSVIKLHFDDSLVDGSTHNLVTSFHASSAILSNSGRITGLI